MEQRELATEDWDQYIKMKQDLDRLHVRYETFVTGAKLNSATVDGRVSITLEKFAFYVDASPAQWLQIDRLMANPDVEWKVS